MAQLYRSVATLRIAGDELIPEEVTRLLGAQPTMARKKGDVRRLPNGREIINRTGQWHLSATDREPENVDGQVAEILGKLNADLSVWASLAEQFSMDLFCGWFMQETNEGLSISPKAMLALASRGIEFGADIYAPPRDDGEEPASP